MAINGEYFLLTWKHKSMLVSAFPVEESRSEFEIIPELKGKGELPFEFELKTVKEVKNGIEIDEVLEDVNDIWTDYMPNSLAWPLMSEKLKSIIEQNLTGKENVDWIKCKIKVDATHKNYYLMRFNEKLDVLDLNKTIYVPGTDHIIKPVFSSDKVRLYRIFNKPAPEGQWEITSGIYIDKALKTLLIKEGVTGLDFEKTVIT